MSREKGDAFEKENANYLDLKRTAKSGGHWDDADLYAEQGPLKNFIIECKYKNIPFFRSVKSELEKLIKQALKNGNKSWAYIQRNQSGDFILMDLNDFIDLLNKL